MAARTQIILPSSGTLDLYDDIDTSYNFNVADIRDPEAGVADYSKTITIPGTKNNNTLLKQIFEINVFPSFDPRFKLKCHVLVYDMEIINGNLRLTRVVERGNGEFDYEIIIIGEVASLFKDIRNDELTALDISRLNHTYNSANIVASWTATRGEGYVYPFMDLGNFPANANYLQVKHFFPAIYVKELIDRVFEKYGYQYASTFLTSTHFKNLIIPLNADAMSFRLTSDQIAEREFRVSRETTGQVVTLNNNDHNREDVVIFNDDTFGANKNPSSIVNTGTGVFTAIDADTYRFSASVTVDWGGINPLKILNAYIRIWIVDVANNNVILQDSNAQGTLNAQTFTFTIAITQPVFMAVGDVAYIKLHFRDFAALPSCTIKTGSYFYNVVYNASFEEGETISMNACLPQKVKITDFFSWLKKLFNLYFSIDKDNARKYIIEPRDDWYNSTVVNWEDKPDLAFPREWTPMGELKAKRYLFQYKKDEDFYNTVYQGGTGETYGTRKKVVPTDLLKEDYIVEPGFAASPLHSDSLSDRVYVKIRNKTGLPGPNGTILKTGLRLLYYGGLLPSNNTWYLNQTPHTTYPYAGHLDNPYAPTRDLCYGVPREIYYQATTYTNNNLYNLYWRGLIDEIINKDSRILTVRMNLTAVDIATLNPRSLYFFFGNYWRLNKIMDYNPNANASTKCEFIKVISEKKSFN